MVSGEFFEVVPEELEIFNFDGLLEFSKEWSFGRLPPHIYEEIDVSPRTMIFGDMLFIVDIPLLTVTLHTVTNLARLFVLSLLLLILEE